MPIYVTGYQFNGPSGPGCIAHHHFGTVPLCLYLSALCQHFQRASPLQLLGQFQFNFLCSLQEKGGSKCLKNSYHMTVSELRGAARTSWSSCFYLFLAPLSRRLRGSFKYGKPPSSVRRPSTLSNDFSSETTGPNVTKFHV